MSDIKIPSFIVAFGVLLCIISSALKIQQIGFQSALPFLIGIVLILIGFVMIAYRILTNRQR